MRFAVVLAAICAMASAPLRAATPATVPNVNDPSSATGKTRGVGALLVDPSNNQIDGTNPLPVGDASNASFVDAVGPIVAGTDYSASRFRAWTITCTATASTNITLLSGKVLPVALASGATYERGDAVKSWDAVPPVCAFYGRP